MVDNFRIMTHVRKVLTDTLPNGCRIKSVLPADPTNSGVLARLRLKRAPAGALPIAIRCIGWGTGYEEIEREFLTAIDTTTTTTDAADKAVRYLTDDVFRQQIIAQDARRHGIERPLAGRDMLRTDHLVVDPDAVSSLVGLLGGEDAARAWIMEQLERRMRRAEGLDPVGRIPIMASGSILKIDFQLAPLSVDETADWDGLSRWDGDVVTIKGKLPTTMESTIVGMRLGDIVSGTPIGHRMIEAFVDSEDDERAAFIALSIETTHVPLDGILASARS